MGKIKKLHKLLKSIKKQCLKTNDCTDCDMYKECYATIHGTPAFFTDVITLKKEI